MATRQRGAAAPPETLGDPPTPPNGAEWRAPAGALTAPPGADFEEEDEGEDAAERIRQMLSGAGSEVRVKVYRTDPRTARLQWCCDLSPHEFEAGGLDEIRAAWGHGEFEVRVIGPRGILGRSRFSIAKQQDNPAPLASAQVNATDPALAMILGKIAESQAVMMQLIGKIADKPAPDPMAQFGAMLGAMTQMREAMGLNVPPPPPPPASDPATMLGTLVNAFKTMKEAASEFGGKPEPEDSLTGLAGKVIDMVGPQLVQGGAPAPAALPMPGVSLPASFAPAAVHADATLPVQPVAPQALPEDMQTLVLRGTLQGLIDLGKQGKEPKEGGAYIADKLPDDLLPYLDLPNWHDLLKMAAGMVGVQLPEDLTPWLSAARDEAVKLLSEPADD